MTTDRDFNKNSKSVSYPSNSSLVLMYIMNGQKATKTSSSRSTYTSL